MLSARFARAEGPHLLGRGPNFLDHVPSAVSDRPMRYFVKLAAPPLTSTGLPQGDIQVRDRPTPNGAPRLREALKGPG